MAKGSARVIFSVGLLLSLLMVACGTNLSTGKGKVIQIVAAENFWGSIAAQIGGKYAVVTNIIDNPNVDPHDYEPTADDARAVASAQYAIINGAGYDSWADKLLSANPVSGRKTLNVGDLTGKKAGDNPHLWYNPEYITAVINKIRDDLAALDPTDAAAIKQSAQTYATTGLGDYHNLIAQIKATYSGVPVGATESIFAYLAPALGLNLITPPAYLKAVSEGTDIAAADEATVEQQIKTKTIKVLIYNSQNTPNNITAIINLAQGNGIPVTTITETLTPAGATFQSWQTVQLAGIRDALARATGK